MSIDLYIKVLALILPLSMYKVGIDEIFAKLLDDEMTRFS